MSEPKDPRKELSRELAELLQGPDTLHAARLLELCGIFRTAGTEPEAPSPREEAAAEPRPIRIWRPRQVEGELVFERPAPGPFGDHYATRLQLSPEKPEGLRRICFFGESAAAGYLYAPRLTPAQVLERRLNQIGGEGAYEVVDLARSNETLGPMLSAVRDSLQLNPDLLVVFSGNNWHLLETPELSPYVPSLRSRQHCALALRSAGLEGLAHLARTRLQGRAEQAMQGLAKLAGQANIPVVVVLPEVNLADWENRQPVPWLPGDATARWYVLLQEAEGALSSEDWPAAAQTARRMRELDQGLSPIPHRLLGRALAGMGQLEEARQAFEDEVEAAAAYPLLGFLGAPQCTRLVHGILRQAAERHGFGCVDLSAVLRQHSGSPLPDRRLFLDYCHLSSEGIHVAMAAVAAEVVTLQGGSAPPWPVSLNAAPPVEAEASVEAAACLGAAIHSAHRLARPDMDLLQHWCRRALSRSPQAAQAMLELVSARSSPCPAVLTSAQQRLLAADCPLSLQHGWQYDFLDADVIAAILQVLEEEHRQLAERAAATLPAGMSVGPEPVDLSRPPYLWNPLERFYPEVMPTEDLTGRAFYRAAWPVSRFCLVADAEREVALEAVLRLPSIEGFAGERQGEARLEVNACPIDAFSVGPDWARRNVRIPRGSLRKGLNQLILRWPAPPPAGEAALQTAIARLEQGIEADLHPVFGEVFSLEARTRLDDMDKSRAKTQRRKDL